MSLRFLIFSLVFSSQGFAQDVAPNNGMDPSKALQIDQTKYSSISSYLEPFIYRGQRDRDPFEPPEIAIPLEKGELYGPFLPLQKFKIDQLTLKGLFWDIEKPKALIADPSGKTYRVGIKDYVGENFGYVASIREKELVIIQTMEEDGRRYSTTKVLFFKNTRRTE